MPTLFHLIKQLIINDLCFFIFDFCFKMIQFLIINGNVKYINVYKHFKQMLVF
jgi:hypothetical protein